ncbi:MAG: hypothetical protein UT34_C0001G0452 [candidate division WS6 bacterium GW2011_GWF2_39_15]|uniref:ComEC/Rec2-related protein domain-containing protein n=1 Tax=candidate division WS6 bacterium GW2011_GWF2_39_15 TaxID=1619100 RepID=A0A0G0QXN7_9BACT|nr:MAG: hypothetical protein UT34_C0001G0452 [candidate division WS6 bacterium GW2011_GWF2_39_15]
MFIIKREYRKFKDTLNDYTDWYFSRFFRNPLVTIPLLIVSTIVFFVYLLDNKLNSFCLGFVFFIIYIFLKYKEGRLLLKYFLSSVFISFLALGIMIIQVNDQKKDSGLYLKENLRSYNIAIGTRVKQKSDKQVVWGRIDDHVNVYLTIPRYPSLARGRNCVFKGKLEAVDKNNDFGLYLIHNQTYLSGKGVLDECLRRRDGFSVFYGLYGLKEEFIIRVERAVNEPYASLLIGIMFGDDRVYTEAFQQSIKATGLSHIVAASGYNILFVQNSISWLVSFINIKYRWIITLPIVFLYCFIAGNTASVLRAFVSTALYTCFDRCGHPLPGMLNIIVTTGILLLINPLYVFDIGFLLSIAATLGIIYGLPVFSKAYNLSEAIVLPAMCSIMVMPIISKYFDEVSVISVLSNAMVVGSLEYIMPLGVVLGLSLFLSDFLQSAIVILIESQLFVFVSITEYLSRFRFSLVPIPYLLSVIVVLIISMTLISIIRAGKWETLL